MKHRSVQAQADLTLIRARAGFHAGEDFHERGLAGAVAADQADRSRAVMSQSAFSKRRFVAETFSGAGKLNHTAGVMVS